MAIEIYLLYVVTAIVLGYQLMSKRNRVGMLPLALFFIAAAILFSGDGAQVLPLCCGVIITNALINYYGQKPGIAFLLATVYYIFACYGFGIILVVQAMVLGALSSNRHYVRSVHKPNPEYNVELYRNLFQIIIGIIAIAIFLLLPYNLALVLLTACFACGILIGSFALSFPENKLSMYIFKMERGGFNLGHGAFWISIGALFAAAFIGNITVIAVFAAIFIGDSVSTLVGVRYGSVKLPYNKKKSYLGTAAYFLSVLVISFPIISYYAVPIALIAAVVESLPISLDDNFSVSLFLSVALRVLL